jgi:hypothetical protein
MKTDLGATLSGDFNGRSAEPLMDVWSSNFSLRLSARGKPQACNPNIFIAVSREQLALKPHGAKSMDRISQPKEGLCYPTHTRP